MNARWATILLPVVLSLACGSKVTLTISPATATIAAGATQPFAVADTSTTDHIDWSVSESSGGSVSSTGAFTATYTAPGVAGTYHVVATSHLTPSATVTAAVTVTAAGGVAVTISPTTPTVAPNGNQTFTATVTGSTNTAVNWTVMEANGGSITSGGVYTAPATPGTFHVIAAAQADLTKTATATVTVATGGAVSITISPKMPSIAPGGTQAFVATVTGSADTAATFTLMEGAAAGTLASSGAASANYTATSTPGTYHVVATSHADMTKTDIATVTVSGLGNGTTVSGTVTYAGALTGPIYVGVYEANCTNCSPNAGTSVPTPGPYTIRGVVAGGAQVVVKAFMDALGDQKVSLSADPVGQSANINWTPGTSQSNVGVTLTDPSAITLGAPSNIGGFVSNDAIILGWQEPPTSIDHAKVYSLQLATGVTTCPTTTATYVATTVVHVANAGGNGGGGPGAFLNGLTTGANYCFLVSGLANGVESSPSAPYGPVAIQAPSGGFRVTGQVTFTGVTPTGPLYIAVVQRSSNGPGAIYFTDIGAPTSPQGFTVTGVPNGTYGLYAFIDQAKAGAFVPGIVGNIGSNPPPSIVVAGSDVMVANFTLSPNPAIATVTTLNEANTFGLLLNVVGNVKVPVAVALTAGPNLTSVLDIGLDTSSGGPTARFDTNMFLSQGVTPSVGDSYALNVTYSDNSMATLNAAVTGVITGVPTLTAPAANATGVSLVPTFSWTLPTLTSAATLQLFVFPSTGGSGWQYTMPQTQLSVAYDVDGNAPALGSMASYGWGLAIIDALGNQATASASFTTQ